MPNIEDIVIGKNPDRWESFWLGFGASIFYAPIQLAQVVATPALDVLTGLGGLAAGLAAWLFNRIVFLGAGLGGNVTVREPDAPAPAGEE